MGSRQDTTPPGVPVLHALDGDAGAKMDTDNNNVVSMDKETDWEEEAYRELETLTNDTEEDNIQCNMMSMNLNDTNLMSKSTICAMSSVDPHLLESGR